MKYHIIKESRVYNGKCYCGASSNNTPLEFETLIDAKQTIINLLKINPVGWVIYNSTTLKLIES